MQEVNGGNRDSGEETGLPVWARPDAFPPVGGGYGWIDRKGGRHPSLSLAELATAIRSDRDSVINLVWTPDSEFCQVPEEVPALEEAITAVRQEWVTDDLADAEHRLKWFGIGLAALLGYMAFQGWMQLRGVQATSGVDLGLVAQARWIFKAVLSSTAVGVSLLVFLILAFIPWYQAKKRMRELKRLPQGGGRAAVVPVIRFEVWLEAQRAPVTKLILVMVSMVFFTQLFYQNSVMDAGLVKSAYFGGEWWRLFTAPMLHGGILHFVMNALALLYLGKRLEVFGRWPHVPMVFLFSALVGGEASARFTHATSVGASGGLMGWLGFLLVFETLHARLVPRSAKRRLVGGVVLTAFIGLIGYRFIDNAAHFGGLVAGMIYAAIVFPKSSSVVRPKMTITDRVIGVGSLLGIAASTLVAIVKITG